MLIRLFLVATISLLFAGCSQDGRDASPGATAPYADLVSSPIRGLTPAQIADLRSGAGMQLALPAELNGFPGPKHVLELADRLALNASQESAVQALFNETNAEARRVGEQVLAAYAAVDQWFRDGAGTGAELAALMEEIGQREAELRRVHLSAHVECKGMLTVHQLELYKEFRGYGMGDHAHSH